ncbi:MAG TPA: sulfatase-like hydrolase/transferase, partial [Candidatus Parabacteroides intestinigallinarum]|nr:sulfatase-like hydrolase/transferase [Candidatus Parabacteroides intestinigallinarum]
KGKSKNGLYGDATEELDWSMGVLFETLKQCGLDENTLVIFTSDNGAQERFGGTNRPLRGEKGTTYEGGFRVPCIMRWPARIPANQENDELVTSMDLLPTLASYCGYEVPKDRIIDGHDVTDILEGQSIASSTEVFYYYQKQQLQAVRWRNWKYHLPLQERIKGPHLPDTEVGEARLYDLDLDLSETENVIDRHPEVVRQMNKLIEEVRSDMGDWGYEGRNQRPAGVIDEPFPRVMN